MAVGVGWLDGRMRRLKSATSQVARRVYFLGFFFPIEDHGEISIRPDLPNHRSFAFSVESRRQAPQREVHFLERKL